MDHIDTVKVNTHDLLGATIAASGIPGSQIQSDEFQREKFETPRRVRLNRGVAIRFAPSVGCARCRFVVCNDASFGNVGHAEQCTRLGRLLEEDETDRRYAETASARRNSVLDEPETKPPAVPESGLLDRPHTLAGTSQTNFVLHLMKENLKSTITRHRGPNIEKLVFLNRQGRARGTSSQSVGPVAHPEAQGGQGGRNSASPPRRHPPRDDKGCYGLQDFESCETQRSESD